MKQQNQSKVQIQSQPIQQQQQMQLYNKGRDVVDMRLAESRERQKLFDQEMEKQRKLQAKQQAKQQAGKKPKAPVFD